MKAAKPAVGWLLISLCLIGCSGTKYASSLHKNMTGVWYSDSVFMEDGAIAEGLNGYLYIRVDGLWAPFTVVNGATVVKKEDLAFYHIKDDTLILCAYPPTPDYDCASERVIVQKPSKNNLQFKINVNHWQPTTFTFYCTRQKWDETELDAIVKGL